MAETLHILVGTMTGNAERVAMEIEDVLGGEGWAIETVMMDGRDASVFDGGGLFLICTSTYGQGDVPDNAKQLYASLCEGKPDLSGVRYGVISLGDMTYAQTFANGGRRFDAALAACGARRLGEVYCHDASAKTMPEEEALAWTREWLRGLEAPNTTAALTAA
jgi:MioC protein